MRSTRSRGEGSNEEEIERARREKREGKKKVSETGEKRKTRRSREVPERMPSAVEQDMDNTPIPKPYGVQGRIKILRRMIFLPMRYPHEETMKELGIEEDVEALFEGMELSKFMKLDLPAFQDPTLHFLASLKVVKHPELETDDIARDGAGFITYELSGEKFRMSIREIEKIYGFVQDRGLDSEMRIEKSELKGLWETISSTSYDVSRNKSSQIRNPAVRYAHKAIAHTLFARYECANVTRVELEMIDVSILNFLVTLGNGERMRGDDSLSSIAMVMLNSFTQCMRNAELAYEQGKIHGSYLAIGSMVTPILLATKFQLPYQSHPAVAMDIAYLNKSWFLRGMDNGKHIYRFHHPSYGTSKILLSNEGLTTFAKKSNILFLPPADELYMDGGDATLDEDDEGGPTNERITGAKRYDFEPFDASRSGQAVKKAHEHIRLLQRLCKWQGRTIKKLVRTVKDLKARFSEPTSGANQRKRKPEKSPTPESSNPSLDEEALSPSSSMSL